MDFQNVLNQILVLFLILIVGYVARRLRVFGEEMTKGLSSFLLKVALPALIVDSLQQSFTPELLRASGQVLVIAFVVYLASGLLALLVGKLLKAPATDIGVYRFALMFSNVGFMGYPVVNAVFGSEAVFYAAIYNLPFNLIVFTVGILIISLGGQRETQKITPAMFFNPATVSVAIGFMFFLFSVKLPTPLAITVEQLGSLTTPLSMILIGALLANSNFKEMLGNWRIYVVSSLRLLVIPLTIWLVLRNVTTDPLLIGVPTIIGAMPVAANSAILAQEYGANSFLASQMVFVSTLLSVVTIPLIAYFLA
ncbi:MAG: AEC family transporter [Firmicutes bacterium]|nr:AEC family transporter [Bacillota bacterium]